MNAGLVYGDPCPHWRAADLTNAPVRLTIDGRVAKEGRGGNPGGDPRRLLAWLVNHVRQERGVLRAGSLITTGSCTGMIFVEPGSVVQAEFPGLGAAAVSFPSAG
jgi:2-keto-4-pentenoate hydratase